MDGIEAATVILSFKTGIPIVAMTANIMYAHEEFYTTTGMDDCLSKPFTSQELWQCLLKYLKPVAWDNEDAARKQQMDEELRQKIINSFVKNNTGKFDEISQALGAGDIKLAHRLAHTLKGNAGQLKKEALQQAAKDVEVRLKGGENLVTPRQMETLRLELNAVLAELTPRVREPAAPAADAVPLEAEAARELLDKIEPLLKSFNTECLTFADSLRMLPGSEELLRHMENFDFASAIESFDGLKKKGNY
jgi:HPt (histidine-containing phosphotransfer) domain-containing protein